MQDDRSGRRRISAMIPEWREDSLGRLGRTSAYTQKCEVAIASIAHWCGWERIQDVNARAMMRWMNHQAESGAGGEGAHPQTIKNHLSMIRSFTGFLVSAGYLPHDPLMTVRAAPVRAGDRGDGAHPFTLDEMRALVAQAIGQEEENHQARRNGRRSALYLAMGTMGLRRAEAQGVVWGDVDLRQGWLKIRKDKSRRGDRMPIPYELRLALAREQMERHASRWAPLGKSKPVFPSTDHNTLIKDMAACQIDRKTGLWHRWRKGFVTYIAMRSESELVAKLTRERDGKPTASGTGEGIPGDQAVEVLAHTVTPHLLPTAEIVRLKKLTSDLELGGLVPKELEGWTPLRPTGYH